MLWVGLLLVAVGAGCARRADDSSPRAAPAARPAVVADPDTRGVVAADDEAATAGVSVERVPAEFLKAVQAGRYDEALRIYRRAGRPRLPAAAVNEVLWKTAKTMHELSERQWVRREDGRWSYIVAKSTPEDEQRWARVEAELNRVMPGLLALVNECCPFMTYEVDEEYRALPIVEAKILRVEPKKFPLGLDEAAVVAWGLAREEVAYFDPVDHGAGVAAFMLSKPGDPLTGEPGEKSVNEFERLLYRRLGIAVRKKVEMDVVWCPMAGREGMAVVGRPFYAFYDLKEGRKIGDLPVPARWKGNDTTVSCVKERILVGRREDDDVDVYELEWTGVGFRPVKGQR